MRTCLAFPQCRAAKGMPFSRNPTEMCVALREHHLEESLLPGDGTSSLITTLWVLTTVRTVQLVSFFLTDQSLGRDKLPVLS